MSVRKIKVSRQGARKGLGGFNSARMGRKWIVLLCLVGCWGFGVQVGGLIHNSGETCYGEILGFLCEG